MRFSLIRRTGSLRSALAILGLLALHAGCAASDRQRVQDKASSRAFVIAQEQGFALKHEDGPPEAFTPWGFNYDRSVIEGRDVLLEDILRERPEKIARDFEAMRHMGGNVVRVFLATGEFLNGPQEVNRKALQRLDIVLEAARANSLRLILTGLANIQPEAAPAWMQEADDEMMEQAEMLFWRTIARHCRNEPAVFAYDLQNEPAVPWKDADQWVIGCFDMPSGPRFCYVHYRCRQMQRQWTQHIQQRFQTEDALRRHWQDYPRAGESWSAIAIPEADASDPRYGEYVAFHGVVLREWANRLADILRAEDPNHLVTVGALNPNAVADAVDFHCVHLYPEPVEEQEDFLKVNREKWRARVAPLPADKPLLVQECYPMWAPEEIPLEDILQALLEATGGRAAGWVSFYWGAPEEQSWTWPAARGQYERWLAAWKAAQPGPGK